MRPPRPGTIERAGPWRQAQFVSQSPAAWIGNGSPGTLTQTASASRGAALEAGGNDPDASKPVPSRPHAVPTPPEHDKAVLERASMVLAGAHPGDEVEPEPRDMELDRFRNLDRGLEHCRETSITHIHGDRTDFDVRRKDESPIPEPPSPLPAPDHEPGGVDAANMADIAVCPAGGGNAPGSRIDPATRCSPSSPREKATGTTRLQRSERASMPLSHFSAGGQLLQPSEVNSSINVTLETGPRTCALWDVASAGRTRAIAMTRPRSMTWLPECADTGMERITLETQILSYHFPGNGAFGCGYHKHIRSERSRFRQLDMVRWNLGDVGRGRRCNCVSGSPRCRHARTNRPVEIAPTQPVPMRSVGESDDDCDAARQRLREPVRIP